MSRFTLLGFHRHVTRMLLIRRNGLVLSMAVNVVFFLSLVFHSQTETKRRDGLDNLRNLSSNFYLPGAEVSEQTTAFSQNTDIKRKLIVIKQDLNVSSASNMTNPASVEYPGTMITKYLMINLRMCSDTDHVDVVIIVHTKPDHIDKRQRMRDSFAERSNYFPFQVRIAFLLGTTNDTKLARVLWFEHVTYNDTVQGDFVDTYHNLTIKGAMGYRWVSEHCSNARFVLKIDDDVLINMYKLLHTVTNHMSGKVKAIFCNMWSRMQILRKGKWKVADNLFKNHTTFPYYYCSGFVVLMTADLTPQLYQAARNTPHFWVDDVYLYGMLPYVVGGVTYYNYRLNKQMALDDKKMINCTITQGPRCPMFATLISDDAYWPLWNRWRDMYSPGSWEVESKLVP